MITSYMDTESVQFIEPTALIQWQTRTTNGYPSKENFGVLSDIHLHDVMASPANETCDLIEDLINSRLVGFNLAHDGFHLSRTYNLCKRLPWGYAPEEDLSYWTELMQEEESRRYCLMPKEIIDLMIIGQRGKFQALIKQKPIRLKKVPRVLAETLAKELTDRIDLNPLYFAGFKDGKMWRIKNLYRRGTPEEFMEIGNTVVSEEMIDPDFVNLVLPFKPKKTLKAIMKHLLGYDVIEFDSYADKTKEYFWNPNSDNWREVYHSWMRMWRKDPNQRQYAKDDIVYTRALDEHFEYPKEDFGSILAMMTGNQYWKGYSINKVIAKREYDKVSKVVAESKSQVNYDSPPASLKYILEGTDNPIIAGGILDTKAETLERIYKSQVSGLSERAKLVLDGRHAGKRKTLLERLLFIGKLYCQFKISGTATNRKSGGSMEGKGESINPQGIPAEVNFREIFHFFPELLEGESEEWTMSGGDAISFEVAIAAAVFNDPALTEELESGKKFHAIFGSFMYDRPYQEVLATSGLEGLLDLYKRSKTGVFAWFYGGTPFTIAENMGLELEQVELGIEEMEKRFPGIKAARERIWKLFCALKQLNGPGTAVEWDEPERRIDTFLGFERDFTAEIECARAIFKLANDMPDYMKDLGLKTKVTRRDDRGPQTASGATMSALYGSAFQIISNVMKIASNFVIQSPGGEMIKMLESELIDKFQPRGIHLWQIITFNVHDEIIAAHRRKLGDLIEETVHDFTKRYQKHVKLFKIAWRKDKKNWKETH